MITPKGTKKNVGFTLTELLLAMLVFAIAITTILALLARSIETVDEVLLKDEAMQLSGAVEDFFENQPFSDSFVRAREGIPLVAFTYKADPDATPEWDGTLKPYPDLGGDPNDDYVVTPFVRYVFENSGMNRILIANIEALQGRLFYVKLSLSQNNPVVGPLSGSHNDYPSAVLVLYAEFFPVPNYEQTLLSESEFEALGISPAFSYTFAVRR